MSIAPWALALVVASIVIGSFGPIFLKKASAQFSFSRSLLTNYSLFLGCASYGAGILFFIPALNGGPLSVMYPLLSVSYAWVCLLSVWLLGERMNRLKWAGIFFIIAGVSLIGLGS